jgi:hypothetical protein
MEFRKRVLMNAVDRDKIRVVSQSRMDLKKLRKFKVIARLSPVLFLVDGAEEDTFATWTN